MGYAPVPPIRARTRSNASLPTVTALRVRPRQQEKTRRPSTSGQVTSARPGPVDPAGYSASGTSFSAHASSTGSTMRHACSASSALTDRALSPVRTSRRTRPYGGRVDAGGRPLSAIGATCGGAPADAPFRCKVIAPSWPRPTAARWEPVPVPLRRVCGPGLVGTLRPPASSVGRVPWQCERRSLCPPIGRCRW